jgi:hypothetical protein
VPISFLVKKDDEAKVTCVLLEFTWNPGASDEWPHFHTHYKLIKKGARDALFLLHTPLLLGTNC